MKPTSLERYRFEALVFERDKSQCVVCGTPAVDAHHIMDRSLFPNGGYELDNGVALCSLHHLDAENGDITPDELRQAAGIETIYLPESLHPNTRYDKWGEPILYEKYPRTLHFPWSNLHPDDKRGWRDSYDVSMDFYGQDVVVTEKLDGENTSLYRHGIHARGYAYPYHPSRTWAKGYWGSIAHEIPSHYRIVCENVHGEHAIHYDRLESYLYVLSVWDDVLGHCLSWADTCEWAELLGLPTAPVLYEGVYSGTYLAGLEDPYPSTLYNGPQEGYVVRLATGFHKSKFQRSVGKYVRPDHVQEDRHWRHREPKFNELLKVNA